MEVSCLPPTTAVDVPHVAAIALQYVDFLSYIAGITAERPPKPGQLREGQAFPQALMLEVGATLILSTLESTRVAETADPPLPTARQVLESLRSRLLNNPESFWGDPVESSELHERVWMLHERYEWTRMDECNFAVEVHDQEQLLAALVGFLLDHHNLGTDPVPPSLPNFTKSNGERISLFAILEQTPKKPKPKKKQAQCP